MHTRTKEKEKSTFVLSGHLLTAHRVGCATGVVVFQDMVQKYTGASADTVPLFVQDLIAMIDGRKNHPCIVQFTTFNEGDCVGVFKVRATVGCEGGTVTVQVACSA